LDHDILDEVLTLFRRHWRNGAAVRLLGVQGSSFDKVESQLDLLHSKESQKWQQALSAADCLRDKYGEAVVSLAAGLRSNFRERTHENPSSLPGKPKKPRSVDC
jgi:DNA polymerase-4